MHMNSVSCKIIIKKRWNTEGTVYLSWNIHLFNLHISAAAHRRQRQAFRLVPCRPACLNVSLFVGTVCFGVSAVIKCLHSVCTAEAVELVWKRNNTVPELILVTRKGVQRHVLCQTHARQFKSAGAAFFQSWGVLTGGNFIFSFPTRCLSVHIFIVCFLTYCTFIFKFKWIRITFLCWNLCVWAELCNAC